MDLYHLQKLFISLTKQTNKQTKSVDLSLLVSDQILILNILMAIINGGPHISSRLNCYLLSEMEKRDCIDFTTSGVYKSR